MYKSVYMYVGKKPLQVPTCPCWTDTVLGKTWERLSTLVCHFIRSQTMRAGVWATLALLAVASVCADRRVRTEKDKGKEPENYIQEHMAAEHHIGAFDLAAFFALHDLDRNGLLDRPEIEAIYGVHHSLSRKHSPDAEIHDGKADRIVREVLRRLDFNRDGVITRAEFIRGGTGGLPLFPEYGKNALGHHYDEESEFYVHHESIYHNKPEQQTDEAYSHKEDDEHFRNHDRIEREEEERERKAEGLPTIEEDIRRAAEAAAKGYRYRSEYENQFTDEYNERMLEEDRLERLGEAGRELLKPQHVFKTPSGKKVVEANKDNVVLAQGEFGNGDEPPLFATGQNGAARAPLDHVDGETEFARKIRLDRARREANGRPRYGQGNAGFAKPRNEADRLKANMPYKYRMKKTGFLKEM